MRCSGTAGADETAPFLPLRPLPADIHDDDPRDPNLKRLLDDTGRADSRPENVLIVRDVPCRAGSRYRIEKAAPALRERQSVSIDPPRSGERSETH